MAIKKPAQTSGHEKSVQAELWAAYRQPEKHVAWHVYRVSADT